jgi:hypothetical protein
VGGRRPAHLRVPTLIDDELAQEREQLATRSRLHLVDGDAEVAAHLLVHGHRHSGGLAGT